MTSSDLLNAFRELLLAAQDFELKAAKHKSVESQRTRLREALTHAQLVLSVAEREQHTARAKRLQEEGYALLRPPVRQGDQSTTREKSERQSGQSSAQPKGKKR